MTVRSVAIACQGGGTHAAFSWGVRDEILRTKKAWDRERRSERFDISAITGTSAGALCALMVWYGFAPKTNLPGSGSIKEAIHTLDRLWEDFAAREPVEVLHNAMSVAALEAKEKGLPLTAANPYGPVDDIILKELTLLGARNGRRLGDSQRGRDRIRHTQEPGRDRDQGPHRRVSRASVAPAPAVRSHDAPVLDRGVR